MKSAFKILTVCAAGLVAQPASAQDTVDWAGFYIGGNIGGFSSNSDLATSSEFCGGFENPVGCYFARSSIDLINPAGNQHDQSSGITGGVQAGYNFQADNFVFGFETDFNAFDLNSSASGRDSYTNVSPGYPFQVTQELDADWLLTFRPRVGFTAGNALIYATGGLALADLGYQMNFEDFPNPFFSKVDASVAKSGWKAGWTAGAGTEIKIDDNWSLKGEYLFTQFKTGGASNNGSYVFINRAGAADGDPIKIDKQNFKSRAKLNAHIFKLGMNYRF